MCTIIGFPSAADRGHLSIDCGLDAFEMDSGAGIEQMTRLALGHAESDVRERASRWLAEVLNASVKL